MSQPREIIIFRNSREDAQFAYKCHYETFLRHKDTRDEVEAPEPLSAYDPENGREFIVP